MAVQIFAGNTIAVIWDFDQTLIPGYQQDPIFARFSVDADEFWAEVNKLPELYAQEQGILVSPDTAYLSHILTYVRQGVFHGLSNAMLKELGRELSLYPGMPDFMARAKNEIENCERYQKHDIKVEHYVVSTGLRQMILGSAVSEHVDDVWACEFLESPKRPGFLKESSTTKAENEISQIAYFLDNTSKTRAIWEINKGTNKDESVGVNHLIAQEDRRVPIRNMIYVADGPSDIPVFSIINQYGGRTLGVYNPDQEKHFREVKRLSSQGRVQHFVEANYEISSAADRWLLESLHEIADLIVRDRDRLVSDSVGKPASHVT